MNFSKFTFFTIFAFLLLSLFSCSEREDISNLQIESDSYTELEQATQRKAQPIAQQQCNTSTMNAYEYLLCQNGISNYTENDPVPYNPNQNCQVTFTPLSTNGTGHYDFVIVSTPNNDPFEILDQDITVEEVHLNLSFHPYDQPITFNQDQGRTYWYLLTGGNNGSLTSNIVGPCPQLFGIEINQVDLSVENIQSFSFGCINC